MKEAAKINLSLSALGNVISALTSKTAKHVQYRDSKLTRLLQDSLGGNTKTVMLANVGPADYNYDETVGTLRFASRAKKIQNKPTINEDPKDTMLREYQSQIQLLRQQLEQLNTGSEVGAEPTRERSSTTDSVTQQPKIIVNEKIVFKEVLKKKVDEQKVKDMEESTVKKKKYLFGTIFFEFIFQRIGRENDRRKGKYVS